MDIEIFQTIAPQDIPKEEQIVTNNSLVQKSTEDSLKSKSQDIIKSCNSLTNSNNEKEENSCAVVQLKPRKKTPLKKVDFRYTDILCQGLSLNQDILYTYGDIVIDLAKINKGYEDRFSAWNVCKIWPVTQINKIGHTFSLNLENRYRPNESQFNKQIQIYKQYPDQNIHNLISDIEKHVELSKFLTEYLHNYFSIVKQNPVMTKTYYQRRNLFDSYMETVYKDLSEQGGIFFASHSGPDIVTNDFSFHKVVYSESLSQILGKSLEELQDMYRRNGAIDFFDFQSSIEIVRLMVTEQLKIFQNSQQTMNNPYDFKRLIPFSNQFKVYTYDDIVFYSNVSLQMIKMSDFMNDSKHVMDFYAGVLHFNISPSQLKQIITIREQNMQQKKEGSDEFQQGHAQNFEYEIQAEIFKEKFIEPNNLRNGQYLMNEQDKTCKYKFI